MKPIRIAIVFMLVALALMGCGSRAATGGEATVEGPQLPQPTFARPSVRPTSSEGVPRMSLDELVERMAWPDNLVIVDTRLAEDYAVSRIPGALGISYRDVVAQSGGWPKEGSTIVLYCA